MKIKHNYPLFSLFFWGIFLLNSCSLQNKEAKKEIKNIQHPVISVDDTFLKKIKALNLIDIQSINPNIKVDIKYSTRDNFMHRKLYTKIKQAYLQHDVALRLSRCQKLLTQLNPNLFLLIYDATRPVSVQYKMWNALDSLPIESRIKFVSNPANGSVHNYGAAVDLTICNEQGIPLDMGANYDDIRQIAYPCLEAQFLASGELSTLQIENRKLLRKIMSSQQFINLKTEWWHFNACSRAQAKLKYRPLMDE